MKVQEVRELLRREPFQPLRIVSSNGDIYEISRAEMAFLTQREIVVGVNDTRDGVPAEFRICSLLQIEAVMAIDDGRK